MREHFYSILSSYTCLQHENGNFVENWETLHVVYKWKSSSSFLPKSKGYLTTDSHDYSITKRFYCGGTNLCSLKDGRRSLFLHGYVMYKKAYLRKTSSTSSSSNGHIPPDTKTNALSSPGIISCFELPSAYITSLFSRSCITAWVRCVWQQIRRKISGKSGRK